MRINFTKVKADANRDNATTGAQMETAFNGNFDKIKENFIEQAQNIDNIDQQSQGRDSNLQSQINTILPPIVEELNTLGWLDLIVNSTYFAGSPYWIPRCRVNKIGNVEVVGYVTISTEPTKLYTEYVVCSFPLELRSYLSGTFIQHGQIRSSSDSNGYNPILFNILHGEPFLNLLYMSYISTGSAIFLQSTIFC